MTNKNRKSTEEQILIAAQEVFQKQGYDGAKMQDIADVAGINKALLHYYYRSKDRLFGMVFQQAFERMSKPVFSIWTSDQPLLTKVEQFCDTFLNVLQKHPYIATFVLHELTKNQDHLQQVIKGKVGELGEIIQKDLDEYCREHNREPVQAIHFMSDLLGMMVYPFIAKPVLFTLFDLDDGSYSRFIEERKRHVPQMIKSMLQS